jgi:predicted O-methyltransferase YrrM
MTNRLAFWNVQHVENRPATSASDDDQVYDTVWIDEAKHVKPETLNKIYELYAHRATQFILIG